MVEKDPLERIESELHAGMSLPKCRKCGCMKGALEAFQRERSLDRLPIESWLREMEPIEYACLGCAHCYPAAATNIFHQAFPGSVESQSVSCAFEVRQQTWPPVPGDYFAFCEGSSCPVAVSSLASVQLAETLAKNRPKALCIVGKTETENIGIDKVIKNTITNPTIRFLLLAGRDPQGHYSGKTLLALWENGVDEHMRVIGSPGKRPVLKNVTGEDVKAFRKQVQVVDMIGCEDAEQITRRVRELSYEARQTRDRAERGDTMGHASILTVPIIRAKEPRKVEMDKAGYFVIIPQPEKGVITVEHYAYDNSLLRTIEGEDAKSIYSAIIEGGWVTQLTHAAYLGKEIAKAQLSLKLGFKYVQDGG